MILRQFLALGVIGGILGTGAYFYSKRQEYNFSLWALKPLTTLALCAIFLIFVLAIGLASPVESNDIETMYYALMVLFGLCLAPFAGTSYFYWPYEIAGAHLNYNYKDVDTGSLFLIRKIGMAHFAIGLALTVIGLTKEGPLAGLLLIVVWGWANALLFFFRAYHGFDIELSKEKKLEDGVTVEGNAEPDREASLRMYEMYFNITIPLMFLVLYITGFT